MSMLSVLQTKKLGLFELLAMGCELYLQHFRRFTSLILILLPFSVLFQIASVYPPANIFSAVAVFFLFILYVLVAIPFYSVALAVLAETRVMGRKPKLREELNRISAYILPVIGLSLRFSVILILRFFLLIIPGVIYAVDNGYYFHAFIFRGQKGKAAFRYSRELVKGNRWKVCALNVLVTLASIGLPVFISELLTVFIFISPTVVSIISDVLASFISLGLFGIASVLLFLNLDFQKR